MTRTTMDALAIWKPIKGVLLKLAMKEYMIKENNPAIMENTQKMVLSQRLDNIYAMNTTGMTQKK
jgi:hypothetical protein